MVGETRKPPTLIHRPFAKAVRARDTTKFGNMEDISTTRDSAASRSRNSHITQVKKAIPSGRKFDSQYAITEKSSEMRTGGRVFFKLESPLFSFVLRFEFEELGLGG